MRDTDKHFNFFEECIELANLRLKRYMRGSGLFIPITPSRRPWDEDVVEATRRIENTTPEIVNYSDKDEENLREAGINNVDAALDNRGLRKGP